MIPTVRDEMRFRKLLSEIAGTCPTLSLEPATKPTSALPFSRSEKEFNVQHVRFSMFLIDVFQRVCK